VRPVFGKFQGADALVQAGAFDAERASGGRNVTAGPFQRLPEEVALRPAALGSACRHISRRPESLLCRRAPQHREVAGRNVESLKGFA